MKRFGFFDRGKRRVALVAFVGSTLVTIFFFDIKLRVGHRVLINRLSDFQRTLLPVITTYNNVLIPILVCCFVATKAPTRDNLTVPVTASVTFSLKILDLFNGQIPLDLGIFLATFTIISSVNNVLIVTLFCASRLTIGCLVTSTNVLLVLYNKGFFQIHGH